jgi:hypothetical protein
MPAANDEDVVGGGTHSGKIRRLGVGRGARGAGRAKLACHVIASAPNGRAKQPCSPTAISRPGSWSNPACGPGVANDLRRRVAEHRSGQDGACSRHYALDTLVWYEWHADIRRPLLVRSRSRLDLVA